MRLAVALFFVATVALAQPPPAAPARTAVGVLPNGKPFTLEVAAEPAARARGYMFREAVGAGEGMLFVFDEEAPHSFWMKNCRVALDLVWLDAAFRVVHIAAGVPPCPATGDCPSIVPPVPARYAVEFASGTAAREALAVGDSLTILRNDTAR